MGSCLVMEPFQPSWKKVADEDGEDQGAHHGHDLGNRQLKGDGQAGPLLGGGGNVQVGNDGVARAHGHESGQHRAHIGNYDRHPQQAGGVTAQLGDGGGDEADDNEGDAEIDDLSQDVFGRTDNVDHSVREGQGAPLGDEQAQRRAGDYADEQPQGQVSGFFHSCFLSYTQNERSCPLSYHNMPGNAILCSGRECPIAHFNWCGL